VNYRFAQRGTGFPGSEPELELQWFMNKDFRLATLRDWKKNETGKVIDFTRYDLKAQEPADAGAGGHHRNWGLMNRINQKGLRPQDAPSPFSGLTADEQTMILRRYPVLEQLK
jgi:Domain of Unknown Function with PDB structure (DUF3864)